MTLIDLTDALSPNEEPSLSPLLPPSPPSFPLLPPTAGTVAVALDVPIPTHDGLLRATKYLRDAILIANDDASTTLLTRAKRWAEVLTTDPTYAHGVVAFAATDLAKRVVDAKDGHAVRQILVQDSLAKAVFNSFGLAPPFVAAPLPPPPPQLKKAEISKTITTQKTTTTTSTVTTSSVMINKTSAIVPAPVAPRTTTPPKATTTTATTTNAQTHPMRAFYQSLRNANFKANFQLPRLLNLLTKHLGQARNTRKTSLELFVGGKTQIGKTKSIGVVGLAARTLNHPCIVIVPTMKGAQDILAKCQRDHPQRQNDFCLLGSNSFGGIAPGALRGYKGDLFFVNHLASGGVLIVPYLKHALDRLHRILNMPSIKSLLVHRPFVLNIDESDEVCWVDPEETNQREYLVHLLIVGDNGVPPPAIVVRTSATLLPNLAVACRDESNSGVTRELLPVTDHAGDDGEYAGLRDMAPMILTDPTTGESRPVFLDDDATPLNKTNAYVSPLILAFIKAGCEEDPDDGLVVAVTDPYVNAQGGLRDQAAHLEFEVGYGKAAVAAYSASLNVYRINGVEHVIEGADARRMSVDEFITRVRTAMSVAMPIILLGYNAINRGLSLRTDTIVPTHIVVALQPGQSVERVVQTLGRGTGNFRGLQRHPVRVLTWRKDYELALKYAGSTEDMQARMAEDQGLGFLGAAAATMSGMSGGLRETPRPVAKRKLGLKDELLRLSEEMDEEGEKRGRFD